MKTVKMGMDVYATDSRAGRVDDVLVSAETGQPAFVVVNAGGFFSSDVVVPFESVRNVDDAGVWLTLTREQVQHSAAFDPARHCEVAGFTSYARAHFGDKD
jgi:uncharacterized protein YrrD